MGMHHGIVAADVPADRLLDAMRGHTGDLTLGPAHATFNEIDLEPRDDGWAMAMGERDGRTYVLDTSMLLSDFDLIKGLSEELSAIVVGCGAETTSGSYWLTAARDGELLRAYWNCYTDMRQPWSVGDPLETEATHPLEDLDGDGMIAALRGFGLEYESWQSSGPYRRLFYSGERLPEKGPLAAEFDAFYASVRIPENQQPKPTVLQRGGGAYDLIPSGSPLSKGQKPREERGLFGFLKRR